MAQEVVAQLGELDAQGRVQARLLAARITGGAMQGRLFEPLPQGQAPVQVGTDQVWVERARSFGAVWLGWMLWRSLGLDRLCEVLLPRGRAEVPWAVMATVLVVARLCEPSSELHIAEAWYRHTALADLIGLPPGQVNDDRLYRALDRLLPHKGALEQHLRARLGELFALDYDLLLYDVTSTYFGAPGQAWRIQRVKFPSQEGAKPPLTTAERVALVAIDALPHAVAERGGEFGVDRDAVVPVELVLQAAFKQGTKVTFLVVSDVYRTGSALCEPFVVAVAGGAAQPFEHAVRRKSALGAERVMPPQVQEFQVHVEV